MKRGKMIETWVHTRLVSSMICLLSNQEYGLFHGMDKSNQFIYDVVITHIHHELMRSGYQAQTILVIKHLGYVRTKGITRSPSVQKSAVNE